MCKELGRLAQGWGGKEGTDMVFFMTPEELTQIPRDRTVTYTCIVVDFTHKRTIPTVAASLLVAISLITLENRQLRQLTSQQQKYVGIQQ